MSRVLNSHSSFVTAAPSGPQLGVVATSSSLTEGSPYVVDASPPNTMTFNILLTLPSEILHNIFSHIEPTDLVSVQLCGHYANEFVKSDRLLHRELYLQRFVSWLSSPYRLHEIDET